MTKQPIDPLAATGYAQPSAADSLGATGVHAPQVDPLGQTGFAQPVAADPLGATAFQQVQAPPGPVTSPLVAQPTHVGPAPAPNRAPQPPADASYAAGIAPEVVPQPYAAPDPRRAAQLAVAEPSASVLAGPLPVQRGSRAWIGVVVLLALAGGAVGVVLATRGGGGGGGSTSAGAGSTNAIGSNGSNAGSNGEAAEPRGPEAKSPEQLADIEDTALARDDAMLATLLAPDVFAIGPGAQQIAIGRDKAVDMLGRATNPSMSKQLVVRHGKRRVGRAGDVAWISEPLEIAPPTVTKPSPFVTTQVAIADAHGVWHVAAWQIAIALPDPDAYRSAAKHGLPALAPVEDSPGDLATAFRAVLASRQAFAAAFSQRDDVTTIGSSPDDVLVGGKRSQAWFKAMSATLAIAGGVHCAGAGDAAWCTANVDFTATVPKYGKITEPFRTLVVLLREDGAWHVVQAQFSNGM